MFLYVRGGTRPYGNISKSPPVLNVEVDASANLFKKYLKHDSGLEDVSKGQDAVLWARTI